jgi:hypothetical protein
MTKPPPAFAAYPRHWPRLLALAAAHPLRQCLCSPPTARAMIARGLLVERYHPQPAGRQATAYILTALAIDLLAAARVPQVAGTPETCAASPALLSPLCPERAQRVEGRP